jgi:hypothetical protein
MIHAGAESKGSMSSRCSNQGPGVGGGGGRVGGVCAREGQTAAPQPFKPPAG